MSCWYPAAGPYLPKQKKKTGRPHARNRKTSRQASFLQKPPPDTPEIARPGSAEAPRGGSGSFFFLFCPPGFPAGVVATIAPAASSTPYAYN